MNTTDFANLKVAFKTWHGNYLRADKDNNFVNTASSIKEWEFWTIIPLNNKEFAIRSFHNKYLCAHGRNEGDTLNQSTNLGTWERFKLIDMRDDSWAIQSVAHGSYIRTHGDGRVDMQVHIKGYEKYNIKILSQPEIVKDLIYEFDKKEMISEKLMTIFTIIHENDHNKPSIFKYTFKEGISKSFVFTQTRGANIGINTKLFARIPEVAEGTSEELETSYEMEWNWISGTEIITTLPIQLETKISVDPKESVKVSLTACKRQMKVPWTATAIYKIDDKEIKKDIGGVWSGTIFFNVRAKIISM